MVKKKYRKWHSYLKRQRATMKKVGVREYYIKPKGAKKGIRVLAPPPMKGGAKGVLRSVKKGKVVNKRQIKKVSTSLKILRKQRALMKRLGLKERYIKGKGAKHGRRVIYLP